MAFHFNEAEKKIECKQMSPKTAPINPPLACVNMVHMETIKNFIHFHRENEEIGTIRMRLTTHLTHEEDRLT